MSQNACSTNRTDADSPMPSTVELLHKTDKEAGIPNSLQNTFCCNIHPT